MPNKEKAEKEAFIKQVAEICRTGRSESNRVQAMKLLIKLRAWDVEGRELAKTKAAEHRQKRRIQVERRARLKRQQEVEPPETDYHLAEFVKEMAERKSKD